VDKAHGNLSGPATKRILEREYFDYRQAVYARLAGISVAQIYRFRNSAAYRKRNTTYQPTRPTVIRIGERRKPQPHGRPGYLRIDTVHQGDCAGVKGIYHINAVDEVTPWEIVAATPQISELWLTPLLETMLAQFPFVIRGFHSDNGSEFINHTVAKLLEKLLIEQTKSRAHRSGDNGLVEAKNGAVIRKHIGFGHIGAEHAEAVDAFHREHLNPYVNFHRPCAVPAVITAANGKRRRIYPRWATPFELFQEMPRCESLLRPGVTLAALQQFAQLQSDTGSRLGNAARQASPDEPRRHTQRLIRSAIPERRGNGGPWTAGENRPRWRDGRSAPVSHRCPPPLENAAAFSTFPPRRFLLFFLPTNPKKGPRLRSHPNVLLQAHPSMRIC
jgi:transposase InsO family protein